MKSVPAWLENTVIQGFQGLLALRLSNSPPEDAVNMTVDIWLVAISSAGVWDKTLDEPRFIKAFQYLYRSVDKFPTPKQLLDALPRRKEFKQLEAPKLTQEQIEKNKQRIKEMLSELKRNVRRSKHG